MPSPFLSISAQNTEASGKELGKRVFIRPEWARIILLSGELGAGKTTFSRGFFTGLGITENVKSPTFSYFQEYSFAHGRAFHVDLYRVGQQRKSAMADHVITEILEFINAGDVLLIEWADLLPATAEDVRSHNHVDIQIGHSAALNSREITIHFWNDGSIAEPETKKLMAEFMTPIHVRKHIATVTKIAVTIAEKLLQKGICVDLDLVKNGALCHDLVRYVDFPHFDDMEKYAEAVTTEKQKLWKSVKNTYAKTHHGAAIADILQKRGYYATAKVCDAHMTRALFRAEPFSWEEKIVYYADKRALHDRVVTLSERFVDGRKRYAHQANLELEKKVFALEKEIFAHLEIKPDEIC